MISVRIGASFVALIGPPPSWNLAHDFAAHLSLLLRGAPLSRNQTGFLSPFSVFGFPCSGSCQGNHQKTVFLLRPAPTATTHGPLFGSLQRDHPETGKCDKSLKFFKTLLNLRFKIFPGLQILNLGHSMGPPKHFSAFTQIPRTVLES